MKAILPTLAALALIGAAGAAARDAAAGEDVYATTCGYCHEFGVAGAPRRGDAGDWRARFKQGRPVLYRHALNGFKGMPARGANPELSDTEIRAAVDYMLKEASVE